MKTKKKKKERKKKIRAKQGIRGHQNKKKKKQQTKIREAHTQEYRRQDQNKSRR